MTRVVVYIRPDLREQEAACRALAAEHGWTVEAVVAEDGSGAAQSCWGRPGWRQAVDMLGAGEADVIAAYSLDRITRNPREDLPRLVELGTKLVLVEPLAGGPVATLHERTPAAQGQDNNTEN